MAERTLTATLPDGSIATRKTSVRYTHVVAVERPDGSWAASTWTRTLHRSGERERRQLESSRERHSAAGLEFKPWGICTVRVAGGGAVMTAESQPS